MREETTGIITTIKKNMKTCFLNQSDDENYHLIRGKPSSVVADIDKADLPDYNNTSSIFYRIPPKCQSHCKED